MPARIATPIIDWLALPGLLFIRLIQMIMIPLVVTSVIRGIVGGGDPAELKVLGPRVAMFFLVFTVAAIVIGIGVASWLRPGDLLAAQGWGLDAVAPDIAAERPTVTSFITDLLPENPLASMVSGEMLSIVVFATAGRSAAGAGGNLESVSLINGFLDQAFNWNVLLLLPLLIVLVGSMMRKPTVPVMILASVVAPINAVIFQDPVRIYERSSISHYLIPELMSGRS